jgi:predicted TIM-barrel fold metal-dependent hydrolase
MYDGDIIDPHHHLWDLASGWYPWLTDNRPDEMVFGDPAPLARDYLIADYLADWRDLPLVKSVHITAAHAGGDATAETRWLQDLADNHGFPHGIVAGAALEQADAEETLAAQAAYANVRGIRQIVSWHENPKFNFSERSDIMTDVAWRRGFGRLAAHGLSFDLMLFPTQLPDALDLARAFPETQIILNHTGSPVDRDEAGLQRWRDGMKALAAAENVAVKISDLCAYDHDWTVASFRPFVRNTIDWFGVERCMFASDFPVSLINGGATEIYSAFKEIVADLGAAEQRALFHDNAAKFYRLD